MFEIILLESLLQIFIAFIAFRYSEKFLVNNFESDKILFVWILIFAGSNILFDKVTENFAPHNRFINLIPQILIFCALLKKIFAKNIFTKIFVVASFIAGWDILKFIASPLAHSIFSVWSPLWQIFINFLVENNFDSEQIISFIGASNRIAVFFVILISRAVQLAIFIFYLRMITKNFLHKNLKFHESLFLILPCVTILLIDFTIRLMIFSADNGVIFLIYERVPQIIFFLPLVSLLLLGIIISSVILFKDFAQFKDEEQKNLFLENQISEIHKEIAELEEIYSDIRGLKHDLRNHLENIFEYVRKNSADIELQNYLQSMNKTVENLNFADKTGNAITDIIFHRTRQICNKKNISFSANFIFVNRFDIYDICVILNNALENAIEAVEKICGEKFISIKSYERGNLYFIEIENNFVGEMNFEDLPATTKAEKNLHGFGLENIRRRARKYNGEIEISADKNIFKLAVMLYKPI